MRKRLAHFSKQQQEDRTWAKGEKNPADVLFQHRPVTSLSAQAAAENSDRQQVSTDLRRIACSVVELSGTMWSSFLDIIESKLQTREYVALVCGKRRRYDETPMKVRVRQVPQDQAITQPDEAGLAAKVYQTEYHVFMLIRREIDGALLEIAGRVPTWLQVVDANFKENVLATQLQVEDTIPTLENFSKQFQLACTLPCTDGHASNTAAENLLLQARPGWVKLQTYCSVHQCSSATKYSMQLVDGHVSGMLAISIATRFSGAAQRLRVLLAEILSERLVVRHGPATHQSQLQQIYDAFLDGSVQTGKGNKKRVHLHKRQRLVLSTLLNGNIEDATAVWHWTEAPRSRDSVLQDMKKHLVPALIPFACPHLNRGSWLGHEDTLRWCGLLSCHHNLLHELFKRFCNLSLGSQMPKAAQTSSNSWAEQRKKRASQDNSVQVAEVPAVSALVAASAAIEAEGRGEVEQVDANLSWAELNRANKRKAVLYATGDPGPIQLVLQIFSMPLQRLLTALIFLSSKRWTELQDQAASLGRRRSYRALDLWQGTQTQKYLAQLAALMHTTHANLPVVSMTSAVRCLCFRILARSGAAVHQLLTIPHRLAYRLFSVLLTDQNAEELCSTPDCLRDPLMAFFLKRFSSPEALRSHESLAMLHCLARQTDVDIVGLEARHASNRRQVVVASAQTWPLQFERLSAEFVVRQQAISRHRFFPQRAGKDNAMAGSEDKSAQRRRKRRKGRVIQKGRGGQGGPWRAYLHKIWSGRKGGLPKKDERAAAKASYATIKADGGPEWEDLVQTGHVAKLAGRQGIKPFPKLRFCDGAVLTVVPIRRVVQEAGLDAAVQIAEKEWRQQAVVLQQQMDLELVQTCQRMADTSQRRAWASFSLSWILPSPRPSCSRP